MKFLQAALALVRQQARQAGLFAVGCSNPRGNFILGASNVCATSVVHTARSHSTTIVLGEPFWHRNRSLTALMSEPMVIPLRHHRRLFDAAFRTQVGTVPLARQPSRSYTLYEMHLRGIPPNKHRVRKPLDGNPFMKGVVLKTLTKNPKKPNSGNRKCVLVRLSNGKEKFAHVPGVGHTLQEHNIVLVKCRRLKDTPGVWLKVVRGKYDCGHVIRKPHYTK